MATFTKLNGFVEHLATGVHDLAADQLKIALSNTAPASETTPPSGSTAACILANVTQVSYTNLSSRSVTTTSCVQASGTLSLVCSDLILTATGAVGPFRYIYLYNDTPTSPADPLIAYADYGSSITLASGDSFTIDLGSSVFTLA